MTAKETIQSIVHDKIERQSVLRVLKRDLEDVDAELFGSKFGRFFGTAYYFIKRIITLLIGICLLLGAIGLLVYPEIVLEDKGLRQLLIEEQRAHYAKLTENTVKLTLRQLANSESEMTVNGAYGAISKAIDDALEQEIVDSMMGMGFMLLFLSMVFLYLSRQANKIRQRNSRISEAETRTQDIGQSFQQVIDGEEVELDKLKNILGSL
jgi:predicted PurR-regulated permease PerM